MPRRDPHESFDDEPLDWGEPEDDPNPPLDTCPECDAEIYDDSEHCPKCGAWLNTDTGSDPRAEGALLLILLGFVAAVVLAVLLIS